MAEDLPIRFQESGLNSNFRYDGMEFTTYIDHMRKIIQEVRTDITAENREKILDAVSPFELIPDPKTCPKNSSDQYNGILLIHGLSDSPFLMKDLAGFFSSKCLHVRTILLPGHGTVPGDLLSVEYTEWLKAAQYGVDSFKGKVDKLFVGGFSTGGTLAVHMVLENYPIDGLLLFSPAIAIKSKMGFMANWHKVISWSIETAKWVDIASDVDYAKYESFTMNAADQIYLLTQEIEDLADDIKIKTPIFMAISSDDMTVDAEAARDFFKQQSNPNSKLLWYTQKPKQDKKGNRRILERSSIYTKEKVLNMSHTSLPVAPDNPHYGKRGDYKNCLHYLSDKDLLEKCQTDNLLMWGEITPENLETQVIRKLTFNPDFPYMLNQISSFLDCMSK